MLERGDERELDRLARDRHLGRVAFRHDEARRHRLDPRHLGQRVQVRLDRLAGRAEIHRPRAPLAGAEHVEADVRRDAVEPRAQRRASLEAVVPAPGADVRLLDGVLGLEGRAEHAVAVARQLAAMLLEAERQLVRGSARSGGGARRIHDGQSRHSLLP